MVTADFKCTKCGFRWEARVEPSVWELSCPECGRDARRLIQVHFLFPSAQKVENLNEFKAFNEAEEPSEDIIRKAHRYMYNEEPPPEVIRDVKKHRLATW